MSPPQRDPSDAEISQAERRIFDQQVTGLVGPDGRALGGVNVEWAAIDHVVYGVAFLFMEDDQIGICHLEAHDCEMSMVTVGPDTPPVNFVRLKVPPPQQQFGSPWAGAPGTLVDVMRGRALWLANLLTVQAALAEGLDPSALPEGWQPPPEVREAIMKLGVGLPTPEQARQEAESVTPAPALDPGLDAELDAAADDLLGALLGELTRTRLAVAALIDAAGPHDLDPVDVAHAVWPNGRNTYPPSEGGTAPVE